MMEEGPTLTEKEMAFIIEHNRDPDVPENVPQDVPEKYPENLNETQAAMLEMIISNPRVTRQEMAMKLELTESAIKKNIRILKEKGIIKRVGPDKGGYWEVVE